MSRRSTSLLFFRHTESGNRSLRMIVQHAVWRMNEEISHETSTFVDLTLPVEMNSSLHNAGIQNNQNGMWCTDNTRHGSFLENHLQGSELTWTWHEAVCDIQDSSSSSTESHAKSYSNLRKGAQYSEPSASGQLQPLLVMAAHLQRRRVAVPPLHPPVACVPF